MDRISFCNEASFLFESSDLFEVNSIRRKILSETKTFAFEYVTIETNTTNFPDEVIAHMLGLLIIKNTEEMFAAFDDSLGTLETNPFDTFVLEGSGLESLGDSVGDNNLLKTSKIHSLNKPIQFIDDFTIIKLLPGQYFSCKIKGKVSTSKEHAKWCPVSTVIYRSVGLNLWQFDLELTGALTLTQILSQIFP